MMGGLLVTLSADYPTILNVGDETVEIILTGKQWKGSPTINIVASKDVGITGAHLLQKAHFERTKLELRVKELEMELNQLLKAKLQKEGLC